MSISSTVARNNYVGSNTTATYQYTFKINQASDLRVLVRSLAGVQSTLVINTDYTVTGVGNKAGGAIVLNAGNLANGVHLTIRRVLPLVQNTDIRNQGDFYPETIEDAFDYLTRLDQQQQDHLDRTLTLPQTYTSADFSPIIPSALIGSGSVVIATNSTGTGLQVGPTLGDITTAISLVPQVTSAVVTTAAAVTASASSAAQSATSAIESQGYAANALNSANLSQGFANNSQTSANNSETSNQASAAQVQIAKQWATKTSGTVDGTDYSAKYYAQLVSSSLSSKVSRAGDTMTGDLALQSILRMEGQVSGVTGTAVTLTPARSNFKFQGQVTSIKAVTPPNTPNGALIVLTNDSGYQSAVLNQQGLASDGIITGTGADLLFPNQTTLMLFYDAQSARWRVVGGSAAAGGSLPNGGNQYDVLMKNSTTDGDASWTTLTKTNVGLGNVDNTADANKNVNSALSAGSLTGVNSIAHGGTGQTTQQSALNALAGTQLAGTFLRSDGTNTTLSTIQSADVPTLNQNTTGNAATATTANTVTGLVGIANGGTGQTTQAQALTALTGAQSSGKYVRSDGTNSVLSSIVAADVPTLNQNTTGNAATATTANTANTATTAGNVTGTVAIANGGTGQTTRQAALTALAGTQTSGQYLRSDGTNTALSSIQAADVPNLVANTSKLSNVVVPSGTNAFEISSTTGGLKIPTLTTAQRNALTTPSTGLQIFNGDTGKFQFYTGSIWSDLAAGAGGLTNFAGPGTFDTDVESWYNFNDSTAYIDGIGGTVTAGGVQLATTTLLGGSNLAYNPGAQAFQGISKTCVIAGAYQGSIAEISFYYAFNTPASYVDGDLKVIFFDIDNSRILQPLEGDTIRKSLLPMKHRAKVQLPAGFGATTMNIRVSIYQGTTNVSYQYVYIDNLTFGPQLTTTGFAASDLISAGVNIITATTTAPTKGTTTNDIVRWRRDGDHAHIKGEYKQTAAGAVGSGDYLFQLPTGLSFDTNKVTFFTAVPAAAADYITQIGLGTVTVHQGNVASVGAVIPYDATRFRLGVVASNNAAYIIGQNLGNLNLANLGIAYDFMAPIAGWSSSTIASSDAGDGREVTAAYGLTTAQAVAANAVIKWDTRVKDTHGAYSPTTGLFIAPVTGTYQVSIVVQPSAAGAYYVQVAGVAAGKLCYVSNDTASGSITVTALAGQTIALLSNVAVTLSATNATFGYQCQMSIVRVNPGNQQITATETVKASYYASANFAASTTVPVNFDSKEYDSHNAVTTSATAWRFTAPAPGTFTLKLYGFLTSGTIDFGVSKNGAVFKGLATLGTATRSSGSRDVQLLLGEYIDIRPTAAATVTGGALSNFATTAIEIIRVGSY